MKIIACVKQVPGTSEVEIDPVTGAMKRDTVAGKLNPYDLFSLETALSLAEQTNGTVRTLSMGPPQAAAALKETLWMGAESAVLLSDRKFGGADVAATSLALSYGIREMGDYDLILCGKQTTDGDTAQVGPELAEKLGIEHAANVTKVLDVTDHDITVEIDLDDAVEVLKMHLPCLLTVNKDANTPRLPSYVKKREMDGKEEIRVITFADIKNADENKLGLKGSPTQVERIFPPDKNKEKEMLRGDKEQLSGELYRILSERKFV